MTTLGPFTNTSIFNAEEKQVLHLALDMVAVITEWDIFPLVFLGMPDEVM